MNTLYRPAPWLIIVSVAALGLMLRGPIVAVAPIVSQIVDDLRVDAATVGLLTSIPVLLFALATPFASALIGRAGANLSTTIAIFGVALGTVIRSSGELPAAITGSIVMGVFITVGNVVVPVLIHRDVRSDRVGLVTGIYTSALNVGSMLTSVLTVPFAQALGWRAALLCWASLALLAGLAWVVSRRRGAFHYGPINLGVETGVISTAGLSGLQSAAPSPRAPRTWSDPVAVLLGLAFAGQAFAYYGLTAWLPTLLVEEQGYTAAVAGSSSAWFQIAAVVGALGVPLIAARRGEFAAIVVVSALWSSVPLGLILASDAWLLWTILGGIAQGGGITVVFMIVVKLALSGKHARGLSALVQGVGYGLGAISPTLVGAARDLTGGWDAPLAVVGAGVATYIGCGIWAAHRAMRRG